MTVDLFGRGLTYSLNYLRVVNKKNITIHFSWLCKILKMSGQKYTNITKYMREANIQANSEEYYIYIWSNLFHDR